MVRLAVNGRFQPIRASTRERISTVQYCTVLSVLYCLDCKGKGPCKIYLYISRQRFFFFFSGPKPKEENYRETVCLLYSVCCVFLSLLLQHVNYALSCILRYSYEA